MIRYHISHVNDAVKEKSMNLYREVKMFGEHLASQWSGDYYDSYYKYKNTIFRLRDNMELGIMSEVDEYESDEFDWKDFE